MNADRLQVHIHTSTLHVQLNLNRYRLSAVDFRRRKIQVYFATRVIIPVEYIFAVCQLWSI